MLLNPVRRPRLFMSTVIQPPTVPGASPSTLPTSDSGSNQKPRVLWPNAHPLDHVGDVFSSQMCVDIPQNVPKPPRNRNLKNQNFDPVRIRTQVCRVIFGAHTTRPLIHMYEHQKWLYKLDLTSSCQSYKFPVLKQNSDNWLIYLTKKFNIWTKIQTHFQNLVICTKLFSGVLINLRAFSRLETQY